MSQFTDFADNDRALGTSSLTAGFGLCFAFIQKNAAGTNNRPAISDTLTFCIAGSLSKFMIELLIITGGSARTPWYMVDVKARARDRMVVGNVSAQQRSFLLLVGHVS